jgi:hypothetical protein
VLRDRNIERAKMHRRLPKIQPKIEPKSAILHTPFGYIVPSRHPE